jgi:hypothetical protein
MSDIKEDIKNYFPYEIVETVGAEADDIIYVLSTIANTNSKTMIVSSDHDYTQIISDKIQQFCPKTKKFFPRDETYIFRHIIRGDKGDGIPNIKSPIDSFFTGTRQNSITEKFIEQCVLSGIPDEYKERFEENKALIDLSLIPSNISNAILAELQISMQNSVKDRSRLFTYFQKNNLTKLLQDINSF